MMTHDVSRYNTATAHCVQGLRTRDRSGVARPIVSGEVQPSQGSHIRCPTATVTHVLKQYAMPACASRQFLLQRQGGSGRMLCASSSPDTGDGAGVGCGPVVQTDVTFVVDEVTFLRTVDPTQLQALQCSSLRE